MAYHWRKQGMKEEEIIEAHPEYYTSEFLGERKIIKLSDLEAILRKVETINADELLEHIKKELKIS